jgi:hypothetical protein
MMRDFATYLGLALIMISPIFLHYGINRIGSYVLGALGTLFLGSLLVLWLRHA